ncbi:hypothetical protein NS44R_14660 [Mammaliicoccus sciuri]|nr:hypothetical protein NS44R_14660 [Mammaliicoccus sciuri]
MIFPGKVVVPAGPVRLKTFADPVLAGQAEIADRNAMRPLGVAGPAAVGKGVELRDIAERVAGLRLDPGPQRGLQRAMRELERAARQRGAAGDGHDLRRAVGDGDQHRDEVGGDRISRSRCAGFLRRSGHAFVPR